ncbi:MAG TPA: polyprenyl diphosphate synthase [Gemmatimonadaceae bacterium]|nr:polyprenyl diphosphate synthase [Gemmatimonadaceae bacterium]
MTSDDLLARIRVNGAVPRHVAIIMDGNGRWARERHLPRALGHRNGMKAVREAVEGSIQVGLEVLSLFAFSQENWQRPPTEVTALMSLLEEYIEREKAELVANGVHVRVLGDLERLSTSAREAVDGVMRATAHNDRLIVQLFISYGARAELVRAARRIAEAAVGGRIDLADINEDAFRANLYTNGTPDPDLLIRTSGEQRISNFMLWQLAYTELHIIPVLWPDFTRRDLFAAILEYQSRERRFGKVTA